MKLHIRLGPQRFAAEREGLSILGTVQRGLQIGALARNPEGEYLQVNGDITQPLNKSRVELALQKSGGIPKPKPVTGPPAVAPTVIVSARMAARCSSTRSRTCRSPPRPRSCAS